MTTINIRKPLLWLMFFSLIGFIMLSGMKPAFGTGGHGHDKVGICHRTASDTNPYVYLEVPKDEANGHITGKAKNHPAKEWKSDGVFRGVEHKAGDLKQDYFANDKSECKDFPKTPTTTDCPETTGTTGTATVTETKTTGTQTTSTSTTSTHTETTGTPTETETIITTGTPSETTSTHTETTGTQTTGTPSETTSNTGTPSGTTTHTVRPTMGTPPPRITRGTSGTSTSSTGTKTDVVKPPADKTSDSSTTEETATASEPLAYTGSEALPWLVLAVFLVVIGAVMYNVAHSKDDSKH